MNKVYELIVSILLLQGQNGLPGAPGLRGVKGDMVSER